MSDEGIVEEYKYVAISYYDDLEALDTGEYGAYTFVFNYRRYGYSTIEQARDKIDELKIVEQEERDTKKEEGEEELAEEIEETVIVTVFEAPALPWYAAWLEPVINYIGELTGSVVNYFAPIFAPIARGADMLADIPKGIIDGFISGMRDIYSEAREQSASTAAISLKDINVGSPQWQKDLEAELITLVNPILDQYLEAVDVTNYEQSTPEYEEAADALNKWRLGIVAGGLANFIGHVVAEAATLGQLEAVGDFDSMVVSKLGLDTLAQRATMIPFEKGILQQAEYFYNKKHPTLIPSQSQLIEMVVKEVLPLDEFKEWMQLQGFNETWSQNIWDSHFIAPTWGEILQAYYRGVITRAQLDELKILVDLDPRYNEIWDSLIEVLPQYGDIINMRVKEVITQPEFVGYMKNLGYNPKWAKLLWDAHFAPPTLNDMLVSWRRGEITEARLDELMILVDLDPRFKDIFDTRKYDDPSVTMGRFMFETGAIDEARVEEIIKRSGYFPDDIPDITNFVVGFQERLWRRRYIVQVQRAYERGVRSESELREEIKAAHYTDGVADWMIETSDLRLEMRGAAKVSETPKVLSLGDLKKSYNLDLIDEDRYRTDLLLRGYPLSDIDLLINLENTKKTFTEAGGKKLALSQSELLNAWKHEEVTEDYLRIELALRGLSLDEIDILLNTKKKQWGIE